MRAEAWFLYESGSGKDDLRRESFELGDPGEDEVVAEPLFGSWEGNMGHAVARHPIDLCQYRGEPRVIIGNSAVVRVAECGPAVRGFKPGDMALVVAGCDLDRHGYPNRIWGYDAVGTMGCLATRIRLHPRNLALLPAATKYPLERWAAFGIRYVTAWSNWSLAYRTYRLLVTEEQDPEPSVWGWGGGTALATVDLARRTGCKAALLAGSPERLEAIAATGVEPLDRRPFGDLQFDEAKFGTDKEYRRKYARAEAAFLACVMDRTRGRGVQIFVDNIGGPLLRVTLRALGREGVLTTCGWKEGMNLSYLRSVACIGRQQYVHTHYATGPEVQAAIAYAEAHGWLPPVRGKTWTFDHVPELALAYAENRAEMFPIYRINAA